MRFLLRQAATAVSLSMATVLLASPARGDLDQALQTLQQSNSGTAATQSAAAWKVVQAASIDDLETLLTALDDATPIGTNWLSSALDSVLERERNHGRKPAREVLESFILDAQHSSIARETALDLLRDQEQEAADAAIGKLLHDPVARMRRPAVAALIEQAKTTDSPADQLALYRQAFELGLGRRPHRRLRCCPTRIRAPGRPHSQIWVPDALASDRALRLPGWQRLRHGLST